MPSSAQTMLCTDKSAAAPTLSGRNYSERPLRTYLQQSPPHSSLEPPFQSRLPPSKSARATRHKSSRPLQSRAVLISRGGTIQPGRIVHDEEAYFCLLFAPSTAVKVPSLSCDGGGSQREDKKKRAGTKCRTCAPRRGRLGLCCRSQMGHN